MLRPRSSIPRRGGVALPKQIAWANQQVGRLRRDLAHAANPATRARITSKLATAQAAAATLASLSRRASAERLDLSGDRS